MGAAMIILLILFILFMGCGGGYWGHDRWGGYAGPGIGVGTILLILLLVYMFGGFR